MKITKLSLNLKNKIILIMLNCLKIYYTQLYATAVDGGLYSLLEYDSIKKYLYAGIENGIISIWDLNSNLLIKTFDLGNNIEIKSIKKLNYTHFSLITKNQLVLISDIDYKEKTFELANGIKPNTLNIINNDMKVLISSSNGIGQGARHFMSIFCLQLENFFQNENIDTEIKAVDLLDKNFIVTECNLNTACVMKLLSNNSFFTIKKINVGNKISDVKVIKENQVLIRIDETLKLWNLELNQTIDLKNSVKLIELIDETFFLVVNCNSQIELWNIKTRDFNQSLINNGPGIIAIKSISSSNQISSTSTLSSTLAKLSSTQISTSTLAKLSSTQISTSTLAKLSSTEKSTPTLVILPLTEQLNSTLSNTLFTSLLPSSFDFSEYWLFEKDYRNTLNTKELLKSNFDLTDCLKNCSGNGKCKVSLKDFKFLCDCLDFFSGSSCNIDIRPCSSNPCKNNGTCINNLVNKSYTCQCFNEFFYGKNCEFKRDVCENETCSKNGVCYEFQNESKCKCYSLYNGTRCEILSDELNVIKFAIKTSSIIAIAILVLTFVFIAINDLVNFSFKKNPSS
ncbi:unnamed protein product [Brachionus calyciflorus]|uniref:EGF-like domain-containing protein n=1 Tax=Brachionus calyciflorus TaxID=104777 RepID=A0A813SHV2_9BILA|nr:unnamed protein product [Brachionus calyciflorus]